MNIKKAEDLMVIRRNGQEVKYDRTKIKRAITKANNESSGDPEALTENQIDEIVDDIESYLCTLSYNPTVENIQDKVIYEIMKKGAFKVAKDYTEYRYKHNMNREASRLDQMILSIVDYDNELIKQENSNKNPQVAPVQRDYVAGEVSKDISERLLIPKDIIQAHEKGLIHFHDLDYFLQKIYNCCLINMCDVLEYGTVISETMIEKPKSFSTACNVATQVIAQVASSQYGGQSFSLASLVPFIEVSRQKIRRRKAEHFKQLGKEVDEALINELAELSLREEIQSGVQLIQYQILTLMTTNGQTPFVSMFIWINEVEESQRDDFAILIEEVLKQRILGVKNEKGVYVTPAFPKILYVLDENNTYEGSKYYYLTRLAAECTAKRMVPDYISAKKMREYKKGDVYPCMGCVDGNSIIDYKIHGTRFVESFENAWDRISKLSQVLTQPNGKDVYINTKELNITIYDNNLCTYVSQYGIIKNIHDKWYRVTMETGHTIDVTYDHPFETENRGIVLGTDLEVGDEILVNDAPNKNIISRVKSIVSYTEEKPSYDVTTSSDHFMVNFIYSHNCRSFLTPDRFSEEKGNISKAKNFVEGKHKYYGRFNQGVVTLNLVDVACSSGRDFDKFWEILDERLELCHRALRCRHERLLGTTADTAPILFRHGAIARLDKGETIDKLLYDGYSTISLGYAGAYEMCMYMTGKSHTSEEGEKFTLSVMQRLNDKCNEWKAEENIDYSVYGTPLESTTYKFAKCLKERFGVIKDVTDHNYITNSYHCVVREQISAFDKLKFESKFQVLSPGGAISYVEVPDMNANIDAVVEIIQFIYENIMYAEINSKSDYCMECGYDGEIQIIPDKAGKLIWKCPNCGNTNQDKMSVARRTCGYIGTQFWNQGRTEEIRDRVLHVAIEENKNL